MNIFPATFELPTAGQPDPEELSPVSVTSPAIMLENSAPKITTTIFAGIIIALAIVGYSQRKAGDGKPDLAIMGVTVYNFLIVGLLSMVFSLLAKVSVTKLRVPGLTELVQAS